MKKKWLVVMLVSFLSVFVLFGCLPTTPPQEQPPAPPVLKAYLPETTPATATTIYLMGNYSGWDFTSAATSEVKEAEGKKYVEFDTSTLFADEDYPVQYKYTYDATWTCVETDASGGDIGNRRRDVAPKSGVVDVVLNWKGMDPIEYSDSQQVVTVNFVVHVPEETIDDEGKIYMAGSFTDCGFVPLNKDPDTGYYTTEATMTSYTAQGYKFLRDDDWAYVEKDAEGNEIGNRTFVLTGDAMIVNVVESWAQ